MTLPKPLTYDEQMAAEAAFCGYPPDPEWTESAKTVYVELHGDRASRSAARSDS